MANRYWVGGTGAWNDTAHWASTSGGASGASVPTTNDAVFLDANSFSSTGQTITIPSGYTAYAHDLTAFGVTESPTILLNGVYGSYTYLNLSGSMYIEASTTISINEANANYIVLANTSTEYFNVSSATMSSSLSVIKSGSGVTNLSSDITSLYTFQLTGGTLNTNGYDLTFPYLQVYGSASKSLNLSDSVLSLSGLTFENPPALTFDPGTSTIRFGFNGTVSGQTLNGGSKTFYNIEVKNAPAFTFAGSNTYNKIEFLNTFSFSIFFATGSVHTINSFIAQQTPDTHIYMYSTDWGYPFTLKKTSGTVVVREFDIEDSRTTGGASWYAVDSNDLGNNVGWVFGDPEYELTITSTTAGGGEASLFYESAVMDIVSTTNGQGRATYSTVYQALPQKDYEYRVFDADNNFIGIWENVTSEFSYSQSVNEAPTELNVDIARSPDNRVVRLDPLRDESNEIITDENGDSILVQTETANAVGPDSDIDLNYNVDVYAFYGGYEPLEDENGSTILDENSDPILAQFGFPNGKRVYSGYLVDYELTYGNRTGVRAIIVPHSAEMSHFVFMDEDGNTTVEYNSTDPVQMARDAMDNYIDQGGTMGYNIETMPLSGEVASYDFKLQTTRETVDKTIDLLPSGYYHFPDPGDNLQYILSKAETPHHVFWYEKHITQLKLKKSLTQLVNKVYFAGGTASDAPEGTPDLFKYYEDTTSKNTIRHGLKRISDSRVSLESSAEILSEREISEFKNPRYRTSVTISDAVYDIELIKLGQMVGFKNFGTFVDDLLLQIVSISRQKHTVTLDLDMSMPGEAKRLEDLKRALLSEQIRNIPSIPG